MAVALEGRDLSEAVARLEAQVEALREEQRETRAAMAGLASQLTALNAGGRVVLWLGGALIGVLTVIPGIAQLYHWR